MNINDAKATSDIMGDAPNTNFGYDIEDKDGQIVNYSMDNLEDQSGNEYHAKDGVNAGIEEIDGKKALALNGNESYVTTGLGTAGLNNDLRVKVKRTSTSKEEQILLKVIMEVSKQFKKELERLVFLEKTLITHLIMSCH